MPPATKTPPKPAVAAPERSLTQRMEALHRANEIRTRRAQLKRDLKAGRVSIHDLLLEPPEYVETAKVFVITGPSGVGKGTLIRTLLERVGELELSVSATTRRPRPGEAHEVDYHFLSDEEFERRLAGGHPVVLEIEVQGARQIRESMPEAVQIFIAPPSEEALRARLVGRGTDDPEQVAARLATAREELRAQDEFAHVVVNDRLEVASDALEDCVRSHLAACSGP